MSSLTYKPSNAAPVRRAVADAGWNVRRLSEETGIPYSTLWRRLKGTSPFNLQELLIIAEITNTAPYDLLPKQFKVPEGN